MPSRQVIPMRVERKVLDNGLVVLASKNRASPAVHVHVLVRAGSAFDAGRSGLASLTAKALDGGTVSRHRRDLREELDFVGATLDIGAGRDVVRIDAHALVRDLSHVLSILGDLLIRARFPEDEVERRRSELVTRIRASAEDTEEVCENRLNEEIFPSDHAYHSPVEGEETTVRDLSRREMIAFADEYYRPERTVVAVCGDIEIRDLFARVEEVFSEWSRSEKRSNMKMGSIPQPAKVGGRVRAIVQMKGKSQVDIAFGHRGLRRNARDYYAFSVMNHVLGQSGMGGRLGAEIREERGLAYYAYSSFEAGLGAGPFQVRAGVDPRNVETVVECIFRELHDIITKGVSKLEVEEAKSYLAGSLPRRLETNTGMARYIAGNELFGLEPDFSTRYTELIASVSAEECSRVAASRLEPDNGVLVIAGPYDEARSDRSRFLA